jgi:hypothetical protein
MVIKMVANSLQLNERKVKMAKEVCEENVWILNYEVLRLTPKYFISLLLH